MGEARINLKARVAALETACECAESLLYCIRSAARKPDESAPQIGDAEVKEMLRSTDLALRAAGYGNTTP